MDYNSQRSAPRAAPTVRRGRERQGLYKHPPGVPTPFLPAAAVLVCAPAGKPACCHLSPSSTRPTALSLAATCPALAGAASQSCEMLSTAQRSRASWPAGVEVRKGMSACMRRESGWSP